MNDQEELEFNELCQGLMDARLTKEEMARLQVFLRAHPEARRSYVRTAALAASLHQYAGELQAEGEPATSKVIPFPQRRAIWWTFAALAAALALAVPFLRREATQEVVFPLAAETDSEETVARITGSKDCVWSGQSLAPGDEVRRGEKLAISAGYLEVTFDSGAQITVEGPAEMEAAGAWEAAMHRGTLRANVPPESVGFRVTHPSVEIVDLGTEFTMVVDEGGSAELFVLKGSVEAQPRSAAHPAAMLLHEKEARRFAKAGVSEVADRERKLAHWTRRVALDRLVAAPRFARWSFDEAATSLPASTGGMPALTLLSTSGAPQVDAAGRWAGALRLDGGAPLQADFSSWPSELARTVAFWVRIPADAPLSDGGPMLAWRSPKPNAMISLGWNRDPARGVVGALQAEVGGGYRVGVTSLRDGRWHHVAATFSPGRFGRLQMKQYVDGRLEEFSGKRSGKRRQNETPLLQGASDFFVGGLPAQSSGGFCGEVDELVVADRGLAPAEIHRLMVENRLE